MKMVMSDEVEMLTNSMPEDSAYRIAEGQCDQGRSECQKSTESPTCASTQIFHTHRFVRYDFIQKKNRRIGGQKSRRLMIQSLTNPKTVPLHTDDGGQIRSSCTCHTNSSTLHQRLSMDRQYNDLTFVVHESVTGATSYLP